MGNANEPNTLIKAHTLTNAQVGWRSPEKRREIMAGAAHKRGRLFHQRKLKGLASC